MRAVTLTLICAFLQTVAAQRIPTISYITQNQIKDIGEITELKCSIQYAQDHRILWVKLNKDNTYEQILTVGTELMIRDSRFAIKYDPQSATYILQIKNIQETDAGLYQCKILSLINYANANVELKVRKQPIIADNLIQYQVVNEGESVMKF